MGQLAPKVSDLVSSSVKCFSEKWGKYAASEKKFGHIGDRSSFALVKKSNTGPVQKSAMIFEWQLCYVCVDY